jgi:predicted TIM-barrel fold metal-dependent hydrolase
MKLVKKIDAHNHLWDLSQKKHLWLLSDGGKTFIGNNDDLKKDYLITNYLHDINRQGIVKSVHVQAGWSREEAIGESKWLQAIADQYSYPHAIVAYADFSAPNIEEILTQHCQFANVRGIRQILNWHSNSYFTGCGKDYINMPIWQRNFSLLAKYNLSFDMQIYPSQMPIAFKLAKKHSDIQIILNHAGMPLFPGVTNFKVWHDNMKKLAKLPNISVKISGFGMFDHNWNMTKIKPLVLNVIDLFGVNRCMFASNFPIDKLYKTYDEIFCIFLAIVKDFGYTEKEQLFYTTAARIYRI